LNKTWIFLIRQAIKFKDTKVKRPINIEMKGVQGIFFVFSMWGLFTSGPCYSFKKEEEEFSMSSIKLMTQ
jgi:hypothetical protein